MIRGMQLAAPTEMQLASQEGRRAGDGHVQSPLANDFLSHAYVMTPKKSLHCRLESTQVDVHVEVLGERAYKLCPFPHSVPCASFPSGCF